MILNRIINGLRKLRYISASLHNYVSSGTLAAELINTGQHVG
jgi:hypothetical protein